MRFEFLPVAARRSHCSFTRAAAQAQDLDRARRPAQVFSSNCTACHRGPRGLSKAGDVGDGAASSCSTIRPGGKRGRARGLSCRCRRRPAHSAACGHHRGNAEARNAPRGRKAAEARERRKRAPTPEPGGAESRRRSSARKREEPPPRKRPSGKNARRCVAARARARAVKTPPAIPIQWSSRAIRVPLAPAGVEVVRINRASTTAGTPGRSTCHRPTGGHAALPVDSGHRAAQAAATRGAEIGRSTRRAGDERTENRSG